MSDVSFDSVPKLKSCNNQKKILKNSNNPMFKSILLEGLSGGLSGLCAYSTTFPLDVIQTRLQSTLDHNRIKNLKPFELNFKYFPYINIKFKNKYFVVGKDIFIKDGWKGFFKGYLPLLIGIFPSRSIYFGVNTQTRKIFESFYGENHYETTKIAFSAIMGSITASTFTSPIWVTKTHLQLKRGLISSYYGSIETMIYWLLYEQFKKKIQDFNGNNNRELSALDSTKASLFAKTISIICGYPHEVARTRIRQRIVDINGNVIYNKFWPTLYKIYKNEGISRLYSGLFVQLFRQVPNATIAMVLFEQIRNIIN